MTSNVPRTASNTPFYGPDRPRACRAADKAETATQAPVPLGDRSLRLGSLCSGYGGLETGLAQILDVTPVWHAENDPHATRVLAHRWPGVPNHGDLRAVDWARVESVDVMCFGFPCQDLSYAGRGAGITEGTRSGLWTNCWDAVRVLRPRLVFVENVGALLVRRPGFDVVLADMAEAGYDTRWTCLRASDVGACHRRERVFIVAANTSSERAGWDGRAVPGTPAVARRARVDVHAALDARAGVAPNADSIGLERNGEPRRGLTGLRTRISRLAGGPYEPAIRRHEHTLGRPAPAPTDEAGRLSPRFVEWMMMLPNGWVTDVPGVPRTQQLKMLGNGVVPACAAAAMADLLIAHLAASAA